MGSSQGKIRLWLTRRGGNPPGPQLWDRRKGQVLHRDVGHEWESEPGLILNNGSSLRALGRL